MKKIILLALSIFLFISGIFSQIKTISQDSLLFYFRSTAPCNALYKIRPYQINYKTCYYDSLVKPYFLKMLDATEYAEYLFCKDSANFVKNMSYINSEIKYKLIKQKRKGYIDSVFSDTILYNLYKDSVILDFIKFEKNKAKKSNKICPEGIIINSFIKYPESYDILKKRQKRNIKDNYLEFVALLRMEDPETEILFKKLTDTVLKNPVYGNEIETLYNIFMKVRTPFSRNQLIRFMIIDKNIDIFGNGEIIKSLKCIILEETFNTLYEYDIKIKNINIRNLTCKKLLINSDNIVIKLKSEEFKNSFEQRNNYWKKNIKYIRNSE